MTCSRARWWRGSLVAVAAGVMLFGVAGTAIASPHPQPEQRLVERMNAERVSRGLAPMAADAVLTEVGRDWSKRMIADGGLKHRPMSDLAKLVPDSWQRLGENVGFTFKHEASETELADRLHAAFMASPGHRDNILGDYNFVGVGVERTPDTAMWVTVNFMKAPASAHTPLAPSVQPQIREAVRVSKGVFAHAGGQGRQAAFVVIGRADVFADVLGGASLAADKGPILFTQGPGPGGDGPGLDPATRAEVDRVLGGSGRVYLLGGTNAVPQQAATELASAGYSVHRLAGASRVETSVVVAEETLRVHGPRAEVLIARADQWPDAVTGGAYAAATSTPLLLTNQGSLHPAVAGFLQRHKPSHRWALGGTAALSDKVVRAASATRVAGAERTATSVAIAERLWKREHAGAGDRFATTPSHGDDAWAFALAQAPWAAAHSAPQLLVGSSVPPSVTAYLQGLGYNGTITGGEMFASTPVPPNVVGDLNRLVGR